MNIFIALNLITFLVTASLWIILAAVFYLFFHITRQRKKTVFPESL
jgi:hypothetical protein